MDAPLVASGSAQVHITATREHAGKAANIYGCKDTLELQEQASASILVIGPENKTKASFGVDRLVLSGSGVCEITLDHKGSGDAIAILNKPTIPTGYQSLGAWDQAHVKYY